jgi:thiosulfate/3-mercaptopyruvate sulfurtransferase
MSNVTVDVNWIVSHLGDPNVRFVEIDVSPATYERGHIPGALLWDAYKDLRDANYQPVSRAALEALIGRSAIRPDTTVAMYGYGAALGFWLLKAHGHSDVRMLLGSRDQWEQAGQRWETKSQWPAATAYRFAGDVADLLAEREDVMRSMEDPSVALVDVRSELEYNGERFWPSGATADAGRAGHVPGAINVPISRLQTDRGDLAPVEELRRVLDAARVSPEQTVITYCTIGNRASLAWFALKYLLGYPNVQVYYASWVEWGKRSDVPITGEDQPAS